MRVCIVGMEFNDEGRRASIPENLLAHALREQGLRVTTKVHGDRVDPEDFDVVHAHHPGWTAAQVASTPRRNSRFVFSSHTGAVLAGRYSIARQSAWDFICSHSDGFVAASALEGKVAERRGASRTRVINNPITPSFSLGLSERRGTIYVGRLLKSKGVFDLLRAISILSPDHPALPLTVVSNHPVQESELHQLTESLAIGPRVRYVGFLPENALAEALRSVRALVLPSYYESAPRVIAEAHACGTLVIASAVGGVPEMLRPQNQLGFQGLVRPGDVREISRALMEVGQTETSPLGRQRLSEWAQFTYAPASVAQQHVSLYEDLLRDPLPRGSIGWRRSTTSALARPALRAGRQLQKWGWSLA